MKDVKLPSPQTATSPTNHNSPMVLMRRKDCVTTLTEEIKNNPRGRVILRPEAACSTQSGRNTPKRETATNLSLQQTGPLGSGTRAAGVRLFIYVYIFSFNCSTQPSKPASNPARAWVSTIFTTVSSVCPCESSGISKWSEIEAIAPK